MDPNHFSPSQSREGELAPPYRRLVILLPRLDMDEVRLARRIRSKLPPRAAGVLLLSISTSEDADFASRRRMTNLAAILRDPLYPVAIRTILSRHWVDSLRDMLLPDDLLVCFADDTAPEPGFRKQPIARALAGKLPCPVYLLNGPGTQEATHPGWIHILLGWLVSITLILIFLAFEIRIVQDVHGWISTLLLGIVLLAEAGLILSWNNYWN